MLCYRLGCHWEVRTISNPGAISRAFLPQGLVGGLALKPLRKRLKAKCVRGGRDAAGIKKED